MHSFLSILFVCRSTEHLKHYFKKRVSKIKLIDLISKDSLSYELATQNKSTPQENTMISTVYSYDRNKHVFFKESHAF